MRHEPATSRKGPVLLVDDDADIREAMRYMLEDEGYDVIEAHDGRHALEYLRTHPPPRVVLLDWNMAPMSGPQFLDVVQATPQLAALPIVLLTAEREDDREPTASTSRPLERILKPIDVEMLLTTLERYCK